MNTTRKERGMWMIIKAMSTDEQSPRRLLSNNRRSPRTERQGSPILKVQAEQRIKKEWPERLEEKLDQKKLFHHKEDAKRACMSKKWGVGLDFTRNMIGDFGQSHLHGTMRTEGDSSQLRSLWKVGHEDSKWAQSF